MKRVAARLIELKPYLDIAFILFASFNSAFLLPFKSHSMPFMMHKAPPPSSAPDERVMRKYRTVKPLPVQVLDHCVVSFEEQLCKSE